jgi:Ca2+-binding RTX toxin-like protein
VRGGAGQDKAIGGSGADTLEGGSDNDILHSSRDGKAPNTVRGGGGFDICYVDKYDRVKGCEREY